MSNNNKPENVIIIGSGPAAHTAAIYTARAGLMPLMFEGAMAGGIPAGGQLTTTTDIENFPGFEAGISGFELMAKMREQALRFQTRILTQTVESVDLSATLFQINTPEGRFQSKTLIIATGATAKRLHIPGESDYWQKGISACAVCDGGLPIYRNQHLVVIGGGDTAIEEALYLTQFASKVTVCVRRDQLRASQIMQNRLLENPKIDIKWLTQVVSAHGNDMRLTHLKLLNLATNQTEDLSVAGLFYAIGHLPNTAFLQNQISLTQEGYIVTHPGSTQTTVPGVFACGDVADPKYRQAIVAAGSGCMAALDTQRYLEFL